MLSRLFPPETTQKMQIIRPILVLNAQWPSWNLKLTITCQKRTEEEKKSTQLENISVLKKENEMAGKDFMA